MSREHCCVHCVAPLAFKKPRLHRSKRYTAVSPLFTNIKRGLAKPAALQSAYSHQIPHLFRFKPYHLFRFKTYRAFRSQSPVNAQGKMFEQRYSLSSDQLYALSRTTW